MLTTETEEYISLFKIFQKLRKFSAAKRRPLLANMKKEPVSSPPRFGREGLVVPMIFLKKFPHSLSHTLSPTHTLSLQA